MHSLYETITEYTYPLMLWLWLVHIEVILGFEPAGFPADQDTIDLIDEAEAMRKSLLKNFNKPLTKKFTAEELCLSGHITIAQNRCQLIFNMHPEAIRLAKMLSVRKYGDRCSNSISNVLHSMMKQSRVQEAYHILVRKHNLILRNAHISKKYGGSFIEHGFVSFSQTDNPSGFTLFMFIPMKVEYIQGYMQGIRVTLSEGTRNDILNGNVFIPFSRHELVDQLQIAITVLESLTAPNGIASECFRNSLKWMTEHGPNLDERLTVDPMIYGRVAYRMDLLFRMYTESLLTFDKYRYSFEDLSDERVRAKFELNYNSRYNLQSFVINELSNDYNINDHLPEWMHVVGV